MISFVQKGDLTKTMNFLKRNRKLDWSILDKFGKEGVEALRSATPVRTGLTANSWYYQIVPKKDTVSIEWLNSNVHDGVSVAVLIQLGHGTGTGGYVQGKDYINPAIQPIFDRIAENVWKEVKRA